MLKFFLLCSIFFEQVQFFSLRLSDLYLMPYCLKGGLWGGINQNQRPLDWNFMGNLLKIFLSSLRLPPNDFSNNYKSICKILSGETFWNYFILLPAYNLIMWLLTAPNNFEKNSHLKTWELVFFWGVKTHFGKIPLKSWFLKQFFF